MDSESRAALKAQLKTDEGIRLKPYDDTAGKLSIGYGHNLTDVGITLDHAELLLDYDIDRTIRALSLRWPTFDRLDPVRQQVIANMAFNIGVPGLMLFTHTLHAVAIGDYPLAAARMLQSKWARQVGARSIRLATMMETGEAE